MSFLQDNTIADRPMVELLAALQHMLGEARQRSGAGGPGGGALQQLVLILADGRFHEKEALRRAVQVSTLGCFSGSASTVKLGVSLESTWPRSIT